MEKSSFKLSQPSLEITRLPAELGRAHSWQRSVPKVSNITFRHREAIILLTFVGGIAVIFGVVLLVFLRFCPMPILHLKSVSSWQFPNWKCWFSQVLHCLLSTVKTSRLPQKQHLNSLLHAFLKATYPQCLDDSHYLLWSSTMPVTNLNGTDIKREAKNRVGFMLMLREFSSWKEKNKKFLHALSFLHHPHLNLTNTTLVYKLKTPTQLLMSTEAAEHGWSWYRDCFNSFWILVIFYLLLELR